MQYIVLTGGPGAGKTALLEVVRKVSNPQLALLPEAASILFQGGFWRLSSDSAKLCAQRAIYSIQHEMELLVAQEKKWAFALCDRGTLDGMAYWPGKSENFCQEFGTTIEKEYQKYSAVIHLSSPDPEHGYNHSNPVRTETPEQALQIDQKIREIWNRHPNYHQIQSTNNFVDKVNQALSLLNKFVPLKPY